MSRPTLLIITLLVLWLIVLVPMIFRRVDEGAQERSIRRYGRSMRLLNRRHVRTFAMASGARGAVSPADEVSYLAPRINGPRDELFVPGARRRPGDGQGGHRPASAGLEGPMNRAAEMTEARRSMMKRRRRSLTTLITGSVLGLLLALVVGGALFALMAIAFCLGLAGYVYFLRTQALHDRERRAWREERAADRVVHPHEQAYVEEEFEEVSATMVRIDDDSIDLHNMDTIDLTGVYNEDEYADLRERRAS